MKKGFTLIEMAMILVIIGLILGIGTSAMIQLIKWNKRKETLNDINTAVNEVLSQASNGSLDPKSLPEITDAYSQKIIFAIADKITKDYLNSKNATLCDLKDTEVTLEDKAYGSKINNIAVVIFSKGSDYQSDTKCNNETITSNKTCPPGSIINTDSTKDIVKYLTLPELKQFLGCVGIPLKILNNTLPIAYVGRSYNVTIVATGGIKPYKWCYTVEGGQLPQGLNVTPNTKCSNFQSANELIISGTPTQESIKKIKICVKDSNTPEPYIFCKEFLLQVNQSNTSQNSKCKNYKFSFFSKNESKYLILVKLLFSYTLNGKQKTTKLFANISPNGGITNLSFGNKNSTNEHLKVIFLNIFLKSYEAVNGSGPELDKDGDCNMEISCIIPDSYDGNNLSVINCTYQ